MFGKERTTLSPSRIDKVRSAKKTIDDHVTVLAEEMKKGKSDRLERFLAYVAQFHHYSLGNLLLAMFQRPDATRLAGLRQWNKVGRRVKPGEKGIMILAPITLQRKESDAQDGDDAVGKNRDECDNGPREVTFFKPVYVFDIAQTEGEEPPTVIHAKGDADALWPTLQRAVQKAGIQVEVVERIVQCPTALGVSLGGQILLRDDLGPADAFRTLAHEWAHELLHHHGNTPVRRVRETEADAAAYVVCRHFGLDCDSSDYLLLYDAKPDLVFARLEEIRHAGSWIIAGIEAELEAVARFKREGR